MSRISLGKNIGQETRNVNLSLFSQQNDGVMIDYFFLVGPLEMRSAATDDAQILQ